MRDPAFALLPVSDRGDRTVAWFVATPGGIADGALLVECLAASDDLPRIGGGRPLLIPMEPGAVRPALARAPRAGVIVPLVAGDALSQLDPGLLRRAPGTTTPPAVGLLLDEGPFVPARAWAKAWAVVPSTDPRRWQAVATSGVLPIVPGDDTRMARRAIWAVPQAHVMGPPVGGSHSRGREAMDQLGRLLKVVALVAEGRGGTSALEEAADEDPGLARELQHAVATAGLATRPPAGGAAATMAVRVLGRDPMLHRIAAFVARRAGEVAGIEELAPQLLVQAMLARGAVGNDPRGTEAPTAYAAGLFARLDLVFAQPMPELLGRIEPSTALQQALLERTGPIGEAVELADALGNGWWADAAQRRPLEKIGETIREAWRTARRELATLRTDTR